MTDQERAINDALRERSGNVDLDGRLIDFLYTLIRDHVPLGTVEQLARDAEIADLTAGANAYSNGWLAHYAQDLAARLTLKKP